jgi:hypothetical protein
VSRSRATAADNERVIKRELKKRAQAKLFEAWHSVFESPVRLKAPDLSPVVDRYMALGVLLRERFLDFWIAGWLHRKNLGDEQEAALLLLAYASANRAAEVGRALKASLKFIREVAREHNGWSEEAGEQTGLPPTPPMSRRTLVAALGGGCSYDKFNGDYKAKRWQPVGEDAVKYKRAKRWHHRDPEVQSDALSKIRDKFPEKLWSGLP